MDYTLNAPLFICFLRAYLARQAPVHLRELFRGDVCMEYRQTTRLLLNGLQVLLALEVQRKQALALLPPLSVTGILAQQTVVVSYCLTLMDLEVAAELPYGLSLESFAHCGDAAAATARPVIRRVRSSNNRLQSANEKYIAAGFVLVLP